MLTTPKPTLWGGGFSKAFALILSNLTHKVSFFSCAPITTFSNSIAFYIPTKAISLTKLNSLNAYKQCLHSTYQHLIKTASSSIADKVHFTAPLTGACFCLVIYEPGGGALNE